MRAIAVYGSCFWSVPDRKVRRPIAPRRRHGTRLFHDASKAELACAAGGDRLGEAPANVGDVRCRRGAKASVLVGDLERRERAPALAAVDRDDRALALAAAEGDRGRDGVGHDETGGRLCAAVPVAEQEDELVAGRDDLRLLADDLGRAVSLLLHMLDQHLAGQRDGIRRPGGGRGGERQNYEKLFHLHFPSQSILTLNVTVLVEPAATLPRPTEIPVPVKLPESASAASLKGAPSRVIEAGV